MNRQRVEMKIVVGHGGEQISADARIARNLARGAVHDTRPQD
jgi:hypothetical protein